MLDGLFKVRPVLLLVVWTMTTAGLSAFHGQSTADFYWSTSLSWVSFLLFLGVSLLAGSAAMEGKESNSEKTVLMLLLAGLSLTLPAVWAVASSGGSRGTFFFVGGWISLFYVSWRINLTYSQSLNSEDWIKYIPFSALPALALFMIGWQFAGGDFLSGLRASSPYVCGFVAVALFSSLSEKAETINHRDFLEGKLPICGASFILLFLATVLGYFIGDPVISTAGAIVVPFYVVALFFPRAEHFIRAFRYPLMILAIFIGVRYPWLWFAIFVNFSFIRLYNYFRFGKVSPTLKVVDD
ncbi:MAG: hypothetical protein CMG71_06505 [Candidatus Marinimicrobia bacterium]|nr:hypothetical protein [Candidatus Neomarinimicrobiota bacterium]